ncbi:cupin domain-containing protein [Roseivirga sp.]|uniref:cupin domain-containing protein n=1 Tax=Roseivirga sp. TaxID=1964215 RepID=UPI003BA9F5A7
MKEKSANYWIEQLQLQAHPEGGFFNETYRSKEKVNKSDLPDRYQSDRVFGTSIYFLLTTESVSNFHRLNSDEIWHYHQGGSGVIHMISPEGNLSSKRIGSDISAGDSLQVTIPRDHWFAAEVVEEDYILVGCTVSPGFEFQDFELADRAQLVSNFADFSALIERFTRG